MATKDELIKIRVSADEKAGWQEAADKAGVGLSEWVRLQINFHAVGNKEVKVLDQAEVIKEIKKQRKKVKGLCSRCSRIGRPSCSECHKRASRSMVEGIDGLACGAVGAVKKESGS